MTPLNLRGNKTSRGASDGNLLISISLEHLATPPLCHDNTNLLNQQSVGGTNKNGSWCTRVLQTSLSLSMLPLRPCLYCYAAGSRAVLTTVRGAAKGGGSTT